MSSPKRPTYKAKNLVMKVEILEPVREGKLSRQTNVNFSDFMNICDGAAVCGILNEAQDMCVP